jgi:trk system potassium uptake protein TrkH
MNLSAVQRILGLLLMLFSVTMLPPVAVALYYGDGDWQPFMDSFLALLAIGALIWWPARKSQRELRLRDGFLVVSLFWVVLGLAGAVPLLLSDRPQMTLTDAVFEAVSGFTTTGATVIVGLDHLPQSVLYFRQQIQWLGGIGIVVLAVALLPMLGVGGMQLLKAESPGPVKDVKLTPRITETAKALWVVYVLLTALCAACYWLAGMAPFDAIAHSFSTVSTGGHSTHDASLGYYDNVAVELVAALFMFLGGVNFSLHFFVLRHRRLLDYFRDAGHATVPSDLRHTAAATNVFARNLGACGARAVGVGANGHGIAHRRLLAVARRAAGAADPGDVHQRLGGLDVRRHEGDSLDADLEAGPA